MRVGEKTKKCESLPRFPAYHLATPRLNRSTQTKESVSATLLMPLCSFLPLFSQGLFGRRPLGVPGRRCGERERDHLQRAGGDARPSAADGEGTGGRPRPRLGAR